MDNRADASLTLFEFRELQSVVCNRSGPVARMASAAELCAESNIAIRLTPIY
jgi:hypothetical protein